MSLRDSVSNEGGTSGGPPDETIPFVLRHTNSEAFKVLFKEGMTLVEESAAYLDGPGRNQSKTLRRPAALAYATESMRLTTRLMQIASWLLLRRAVNEGELSSVQAQSERHRVRLTRQELFCDEAMLAELPREFVDLSERSLRLQSRVMHLDRCLSELRAPTRREAGNPFAADIARVEAAFRRA